MKWLVLLLGILFNASASIAVKFATMSPRRLPTLADPWVVFTNAPLWIGAVLYGAAFLLYAFALAKLPLNVVHPVLTAGAITVVAICSALLFREPFPWSTRLGILLVVAGVTLIAYKAD